MAHETIVQNLEDRLRSSNYDLILNSTDYKVHGKHGECDMLAIRGDYTLLFEVKGRDRSKDRRKAYLQLKKDVEWVYDRFPDTYRIFCFYVYRDKQIDVIEWYQNI